MAYMQSNLAFARGIQELSLEEIGFVSGGMIGVSGDSPLLGAVDDFCARLPGKWGRACRAIAEGLEWAGVAFTFSELVSLLPDNEMTEQQKRALIELAEHEQARRPGAAG